MPRMPFIGVRISWLIEARKRDLAWLALIRLVARLGERELHRALLGDVVADALHLAEAPVGRR